MQAIRKGSVVADLGGGSGFITAILASMVRVEYRSIVLRTMRASRIE